MCDNNKRFLRLKSIYDKDKFEKIQNSNVAVIGLGGVGSYCAAALARSGVGSIGLVDFDTIEASNINRQLVATESTIGRYKTDVAESMLLDINPDISIKKFNKKITKNNIHEICQNVDYIVDAIDDIPAKLIIAKYAQDNLINIVSCMGTALRTDSSKLIFTDIYKTCVCPMCKNFRKLAKEQGITSLEVLYSTETAIKAIDGNLGSTSYVPPIAGLKLAEKVINNL